MNLQMISIKLNNKVLYILIKIKVDFYIGVYLSPIQFKSIWITIHLEHPVEVNFPNNFKLSDQTILKKLNFYVIQRLE